LDRARRDLTESSFEFWFSGLAPGELQGNSFEIIAPSAYVKSRLSAQHMGLITGAVRDVLGPDVVVRLRTPAGDDGSSAKARRRQRAAPPGQSTLDQALDESPFPSRYLFDTFVTGPSNKFAHAAALAVAESPPSKAYNPVFVYGGVGLGKTHLLFAIANHVWTLSRKTRVRYVTSESFVTEFIKAVRERRGYLFQRQYRDVDVLLLDDVQFLARAEETQTEFFHTFNHLHQYQRQIVIASDRPPQELGGIEERLRSRFRSGLVVDIQPPDLETRIAILQL
jgi:chromosomal replication initiator protein